MCLEVIISTSQLMNQMDIKGDIHNDVERFETLRNSVHGASWAGKTTTKRAKVHSPVSEKFLLLFHAVCRHVVILSLTGQLL